MELSNEIVLARMKMSSKNRTKDLINKQNFFLTIPLTRRRFRLPTKMLITSILRRMTKFGVVRMSSIFLEA